MSCPGMPMARNVMSRVLVTLEQPLFLVTHLTMGVNLVTSAVTFIPGKVLTVR